MHTWGPRKKALAVLRAQLGPTEQGIMVNQLGVPYSLDTMHLVKVGEGKRHPSRDYHVTAAQVPMVLYMMGMRPSDITRLPERHLLALAS